MKSEWKIQSISEIVNFNPSYTIKKGTVIPYVEMAAVPEYSREIAYFDEREFKSGSKFKNGDTLFSRITPCLQNGKTARVSGLKKEQTGNGSTEFIVMSAKDHKNDKDFVYYLSLDKEFRKYAEGRMEGTTGRQRVSWQALAEYELPIPPKDTRKKIAHILTTLDDKIELNRKMNQTLEEMAQALFKSWFVDFDPVNAKMGCANDEELEVAARELGISKEVLELFPSEFEESELGMIPKGWRVDSIYSAATVIYGAPFASSKFNSDKLGKPLIRIRDLRNEAPGVYTPEVHPKGYLVQPGDIVVGMDGEFRAYLWGGEEAWLNQRVCVFTPNKDFSGAFVRLSVKPLLAFIEATVTATTVIHLGKGDIDRFRILLPNKEILSKFNMIVEPIYSQIVVNKQESQTLQKTRDTLLPRLLSGELDVSDLELEME